MDQLDFIPYFLCSKDKRMIWYSLANGFYELAFDIPFLFLPDMMIQDENVPRKKVGAIKFVSRGCFDIP